MFGKQMRIASVTAIGLIMFGLLAPQASAAHQEDTKGSRIGAPAAPTPNGGSGGEVVAAQSGPVGPADRDFLAKVRQAGLWELPAGQQAMEKSDNAKVKEAGMHLIEGHTLLDRMVRDTAKQLGVELPSKPNSDQQGWLGELSNAEGAEYENVFANRLRAAHGKVYGVAAQIRAGTRNSLVRKMATQAMTTVLDHIQVLEATGLVAFDDLPSPTVAPPSAVTGPSIGLTSVQRTDNDVSMLMFPIIAVVILFGGTAIFVLRRNRRPTGGHRRLSS